MFNAHIAKALFFGNKLNYWVSIQFSNNKSFQYDINAIIFHQQNYNTVQSSSSAYERIGEKTGKSHTREWSLRGEQYPCVKYK